MDDRVYFIPETGKMYYYFAQRYKYSTITGCPSKKSLPISGKYTDNQPMLGNRDKD